MTWHDGKWYRVPELSPYPSTGALLLAALVILALVVWWIRR